MITALANKIDNLCSELAKYKSRGNKSSGESLISWNRAASAVLALTCQYPAGISNAVVLAELDKLFSAKYNRQNVSTKVDKVGGIQTINDVIEYGQVSPDIIFRCKVTNWHKTTNFNMKIIELQDVDEPRSSLSMYLHNKLDCEYFCVLNHSDFFITNLKIHWKAKENKPIILPTQYVIPIIGSDNERFQNFTSRITNITKIITNMEETALCNAQLEVFSKHRLQTRTRIDGSTIREQIIDLTDGDGVISFSLFDQDVIFNRMINVGDHLFIQNCILCSSKGKMHLEYGAPTLLYLKQAKITKESLCSQMTGKVIGNIAKTKSGKRNYQDAKSRTYISDFNTDFENGSCLAVVEKIVEQTDSQIKIMIVDESGGLSLDLKSIEDNVSIVVGDLLFLQGLSSEDGNVTINYRNNISVFNIGTIQGFLSSPHLYEVSPTIENLSNGFHVIKEDIFKLISDVCFTSANTDDMRSNTVECNLRYHDVVSKAQIRIEFCQRLQMKSTMSSEDLIELITNTLQSSSNNKAVIGLTVNRSCIIINAVQNYFESKM